MVADYLVVEDLLVLELGHHSLDVVCKGEEAKALLLFVGGFGVTQVQKDRFVMVALVLDLLVQGVHFLAHMGRLVVR